MKKLFYVFLHYSVLLSLSIIYLWLHGESGWNPSRVEFGNFPFGCYRLKMMQIQHSGFPLFFQGRALFMW